MRQEVKKDGPSGAEELHGQGRNCVRPARGHLHTLYPGLLRSHGPGGPAFPVSLLYEPGRRLGPGPRLHAHPAQEAEEGGGAKTFMARAGVFTDLDAAFNFHPDQLNFPSKGSNLGVAHIRFRFHGIAAHAGGAPHLGRSALDAVELMNVGVNYLREHLPGDVRIHYTITNGGEAPNIVPSLAEAYYFIRAHLPGQLQSVVERVRQVANGAAMMTETRVEEVFESATSSLLNNHYLADLQYKAMKFIGPIVYSEDEIEFARQVNRQYPTENIGNLFLNLRLPPTVQNRLFELEKKPLIGENFPALDEGIVRTTSTDVGDLSWVAPLSLLRTACAPT